MTAEPVPHQSPFTAFVGPQNPVLATALGDLHGYLSNEGALSRIAAAINQAEDLVAIGARQRAEHVANVASTVLAGKPVPATFSTRVGERSATMMRDREALVVLQEARNHLLRGRDEILSGAADPLLAHLHADLQAALTEARALDLAGASTAEEAIDAGVSRAWRDYTRLAGVSNQIRHAQRVVMTNFAHVAELATHLDTFGAIRNYADLFPQWLPHQRGHASGSVNGDPVGYLPPWQEHSTGVWAYAVSHPQVELWVPTAAELRAVYHQATEDARDLEAAQAAEDRRAAGARLTAEDRERIQRQQQLARMYLPR